MSGSHLEIGGGEGEIGEIVEGSGAVELDSGEREGVPNFSRITGKPFPSSPIGNKFTNSYTATASPGLNVDRAR